MQMNETFPTNKAEDSEAFSEVEHKHDDSGASFDYVHVHNSIVFVTTH